MVSGVRFSRHIFLQARICLIMAGLAPSAASAQAWWNSIQYGPPEVEDGRPVPSIASSLPNKGDPGGYRKWLSERGIVYGLEYTNDVLANVHGGLRTGTIDQGKLHGILTVDFNKLAGWEGLTGFANFFQIHNTGRIRRDYVGGINTIAAIEAIPTTRLSELWLQQSFAGDKASLRVGQLAADAEFFYSELSTMFLQSDWATIVAANLPSGGAAYPLSTPGVRLMVKPVENIWLRMAVLNGDPAGPGPTSEAEIRNRYGLNFRVNDPPFVIGEAEFQHNNGPKDVGLATTLKLGGWGHFGKFDDMRFANDGSLLANPLGSGVPLQHRGNSGLYAVIDQQLYRPKDGDSQSGVSVYSRMSISPSDQNPIDRYIDGGVVFAGFIPGRKDDRFGVGVIYSRFSNSLRAHDRDQILFSGAPGVIRDFETNLEFSYVAQIVAGWTVQPIVARIWHPSGDASRNATVVGVRSQWQY
jgi:porin